MEAEDAVQVTARELVEAVELRRQTAASAPRTDGAKPPLRSAGSGIDMSAGAIGATPRELGAESALAKKRPQVLRADQVPR